MKKSISFQDFYANKMALKENANYEKDLQTLFEEDVELSPAQKRYAEFMTYGMSKFGAESPADLSDEDKKELFNWIKDNWDKDKSEPNNQKIKDEIAKAKKDGKIKEPKSGKEAANESEELDFTGVFGE